MDSEIRNLSHKIGFVCVCLLLSIIYIFRIYKLDIDLPPWGIINYQPMDEGQYVTMALEKYNYGSMRMDFNTDSISFFTSAHMRNNIIGNILVYIGLNIFGDTYYGIRIPSVVVGLVCFLLFLFLTKKISKGNNKYIVLTGILYIFDFPTLMLTRTVETTVYRELFILLTLFCVADLEDNKTIISNIKILISGFFSVLSVFAVYITNIFLPMALLIFLIIKYRRKGIYELFESIVYFIVGSGIAYIICDLYYAIVWKSSCILNSLQIVHDFGETSGYKSVMGLLDIINIMATNVSLYNVGVIFLFLTVLPTVFRRKDSHNIVLLSLCLFMAYIIQTILCEDYVVRKSTMMYPLILLVLVEQIIYDKENLKYNSILKRIFLLLLYVMMVVIVIYRLFLIDNNTYLDFSKVDKFVLISQVIILFIVLFTIIRKNIWDKNQTILLIATMSIAVNGYFGYTYVWNNNSYSEKETMIEIGNVVGNDYVYGIYSIGFTLYNDIKPVVNTYDNMSKDINNLNINWYLDYENYGFPSELQEKTEKKINEKYNYKREFLTFGESKGVSLYMIE